LGEKEVEIPNIGEYAAVTEVERPTDGVEMGPTSEPPSQVYIDFPTSVLPSSSLQTDMLDELHKRFDYKIIF
jgi:hypothetical protein